MIDTNEVRMAAQEVRAQAESLVEELRAAIATSEKQLAEAGKADAFKRVTGKSSIERALDSASGIVAVLRRAETSVVGASTRSV